MQQFLTKSSARHWGVIPEVGKLNATLSGVDFELTYSTFG
jgi:hypothetical protein